MKKIILLIFVCVIFGGIFYIYNSEYNSDEKYDRSTVYDVKGSELAQNYNNPSFYADKVFNISFRVDHVTMNKDIVDVQYHGGIKTNSYGQIISGARVDILLSLEQSKTYDLQKGNIIKFENMVWAGNEQIKVDAFTFETMAFRMLRDK